MISKFSVKKPFTILVGVVLILILGGVSMSKMVMDLLPNMSLPYVVVITTCPGASPEEVESEVTAPIESAMATTANIENITSRSYNNYSLVILEYSQTTNMDSTIVGMREKLDQLEGSFDDTVGTPMIMQLDPDMMPVMVASADVEGMDEIEITRYVENELRPILESIEGVASVSTTGTVEQSIEITMNQDKIDALNEKIQSKIAEQFVEAQQQLDEAKQQLENGKAELENSQQQMADQASSAQSELSSKKQELYKTEDDLKQKLNELNSQKENIQGLISMLEQTQNMVSQIEAQRAPIEALLSNYDEEQLQQMGQSVEELVRQQEAIQATLDAINATLAQSAGRFSEIGIQMNTYQDIPGAIGALNSTLIQINTGIETINAALENIRQGKVGIDEAAGTLSQSQILASIKISSAYADIASNQSKLETAQGELDSNKKNAEDAADVSGVLSIDTLNGILVAQNFSMPAGYITEGDIEYLVKVGDKIADKDELENLVLVDMGLDGIEPISLNDVADVVETDNTKEVYARVNGTPAIMLSIEKQAGYSTGEVSDRLLDKFKELQDEEDKLQMTVLMDQGVYIDTIVDSVIENMVVGAILAIIILIVFLKDIKPTFVIACSIPLSVVFAVVLMYFTGITLNIISMSGLALGIGMLVDNSIVVIENIYRLRNEGLSVKKAAVEGASQVTGAIIASTLTTVCVFAPIIFTEGITRQLFVDMGLTIAYSLAASLIVALCFVPMMSSAVLHKTSEKTHPFMERLQDIYGAVLKVALRWKVLVLILVLALLGGSIYLATSRGTAFMPEMQSTQATINVSPEGKAEFEELTALADEVIEAISDIEEIDTVGAMANGSGIMGISMGTPTSVTMYVNLKEDIKVDNAKLVKDIEKRTANIKAKIDISTSSMDMTALTGEGVIVQIKGKDIDKLSKIAKDISKLVADTEGTTEVKDGIGNATKTFVLRVNKDKAAKYGMTVAQVYQLIYSKMADTKSSTTISTDLSDYKVYVASEEQADITREEIKKLKFTHKDMLGNEKEIKLSKIVEFSDEETLSIINRDAQERYINVSASIADGYNVGLVGNDIQKKLDSYDCPAGYSIEMTGENENINEAMDQIYLMMALAVAFIYLIMVAQFQSLLSPFIIMFTIPLAFTGGFFALYMTKNEISVIAMIGFVMLAGIIVNNGIVMVDYINQLRKAGSTKHDAIIEAGRTRMRPIFMTALTTIFAMSTMAAGIGSGAEMMQPMAVVTVGGLVYGTLLTLIVVPCIYDLFNREKSMVEEEL